MASHAYRHPRHHRNHMESARSLASLRIPAVPPESTIGDAEAILLKHSADFDSIHYLYIVDPKNQLQGVISIKELFRRPKTTPVREAMTTELITAQEDAPRREVARLAVSHHLHAIPVVDPIGRFRGVVTSDTLLTILHEEHLDSALRSAGVHRFLDPAVSIIEASARIHIKKRLPWLFLGLVGGVLAAGIVEAFERTLASNLLVAAFIPTVVYMADAVGTQTETLFIRSLALDHRLKLSRYVWREVRVSFSLAIILSGILSIYAALRWGTTSIAVVLGASVLATVLAAMAIALLLPFLLSKFKTDPAMGSGPFATVLTDIVSVVLYLVIAQALLL